VIHKNSFNLLRIWHAFGHARRGLKTAFAHEPAFFQNTLTALAMVILAACLGIRGIFLIWIIFAAILTPIVELLNTALEWIVDLVTKEHHPLAGGAKDMAAAAVFLALLHLCIAFVCGLWSVWG